jgi:S1-C subfamily serine protease
MRRLLLVAAIVLTLACSASALSPGQFLQSVHRLQVVSGDELATVCTVFSVGERTWGTAAHCVADGSTLYIRGERAWVEKFDTLNDLAMLRTDTLTGVPLTVAASAPAVGATVLIAGHPLGLPALVVPGTVASVRARVEWNLPQFMVVAAAGAPGNSGSPVVNAEGELVSVVVIGWTRSFGPIMGGVLFETVADFFKDAAAAAPV